MTGNVYNRNLKGKIAKMILEKSVEVFGEPGIVEKPDGVVSIEHLAVPGKPYLSLFDGVPEDMIAVGLIKESSIEMEGGSYEAMEERLASVYHPGDEEEEE